ncbi:ImmA/IrrE family metallo-endopeptidase [Micromonospora taraxaci]|uniref:ImmA/IrrE family metallo-endopeptidase n=1 Tax=Micromonospora taraxaci TaxID=1316803 RepID=UPI0033C62FBA
MAAARSGSIVKFPLSSATAARGRTTMSKSCQNLMSASADNVGAPSCGRVDRPASYGDTAPGDTQQEREADAFEAEFLTPRDSLVPELPARVDLRRLAELQREWGVSVDSLLYRCREVGLLSDQAAARAWRNLAQLRGQPGFVTGSVSRYPGEQPVMLQQAFEIAASQTDLTVPRLAHELGWSVPRTRSLLGVEYQQPVLRLVP